MMTPAQVAAKVAAHIRARGHYQGQGRMFGDGSRRAPCCVLANPTTHRLHYESHAAFETAFKALTDNPGSIGEWNDTHTTAEVLAVLDRIAGTP